MIILECWMTVGRGWEVHLLQSLEKKKNKYSMYDIRWNE